MSLFTVLVAILALGILIIIHEAGHYLVARMSGMRVDRFSIGFGPRLFSFKRGETEFQIAAIPLGGFVQIAGLNPGDDSIEADDPRAYPNRPVWQRLATIFAGPATNYIFAALMMVVVYIAFGVPVPGKAPVVGGTPDGKPAQKAGIEPGDQIVSVDGKKIADLSEVAPIISGSGGKEVVVEVVRGADHKTFKVIPELDGGVYRIGIEIYPKDEAAPAKLGVCIVEGLRFPYDYSRFVLKNLGDMITGKTPPNFTGPVGIVKEMKKQIAQGPRQALMITAIISVLLGLFNLLPLPALDGGRMVFLGWELLSRRKVNQRLETTVHMVGMVLLLCLLVVVTFKDVGLHKLFSR
jgi:regulator of sigma E protease